MKSSPHFFYPDGFSGVNWFSGHFSAVWFETFYTRAATMWRFTCVYFVHEPLQQNNFPQILLIQGYLLYLSFHAFTTETHPSVISLRNCSDVASHQCGLLICGLSVHHWVWSSPTCSENIWILIWMNSHVLFQVWYTTKAFPTGVAGIWLLTCVNFQMHI